MIFVDTNYFLRYLRDDIPDQAIIAKKLFLSAAEGKKKIFTSLIVFFEIFWVSDRFYKYDKGEIVKTLRAILTMNFIVLPEREILEKALDLFSNSSLDFEDCYNLAFARNNRMKDFATFDKKLENYLKKGK